MPLKFYITCITWTLFQTSPTSKSYWPRDKKYIPLKGHRKWHVYKHTIHSIQSNTKPQQGYVLLRALHFYWHRIGLRITKKSFQMLIVLWCWDTTRSPAYLIVRLMYSKRALHFLYGFVCIKPHWHFNRMVELVLKKATNIIKHLLKQKSR